MTPAPLRKLQFGRVLPGVGLRSLIGLNAGDWHRSHPCSLVGLDEDFLLQVPQWSGRSQQHFAQYAPRSARALSGCPGQLFSREVTPLGSSFVALHQRDVHACFRHMSTKSRVENRKKKDLAQREFKLLRRRTKMIKASMTEEDRLVWRLQKANRKKALLLQRLKKYELEKDPEPVHDPELITPEQLQAFKKIGYKNRNYVPVGRRGVYGGVVQNMHMHWKKHETVQVDCHIFKREEIRPIARELAKLSGGIVIDIHQGTTIIMYRGRNYKQPKGEMIPLNTLSKRKALFKSKFLQSLEGVNTNIENIQNELRALQRKKKEIDTQIGDDATVANETGRSKTTVGKEEDSQRILKSSATSGITATSEPCEVSSEDDDDLFSWGSDSLDEEDLSDDQFDYKKAEDIHHSRMKAEDACKGPATLQDKSNLNEDDQELDMAEFNDNDTDGSEGLKLVENQFQNEGGIGCGGEEKEKLHSRASGVVQGRDGMTGSCKLRYQERHKKTAHKRNDKGQQSRHEVHVEESDTFYDDSQDDSDDAESGLSKGREKEFEKGPMSCNRNTTEAKRQKHFRNGKISKPNGSDEGLDVVSDEEESWENEELEGFDSQSDEQDDYEDESEARRRVKAGKKEDESSDDWFDDDSEIEGDEVGVANEPSRAKDR